VMYSSQLSNNPSILSIDASRWSKGIYFIRAQGDQNIITRKVVLH
jgi:hypothetical protein